LITGFIYPVVVHWVWDDEGWISAFNDDTFEGGMIDFAGSGVVHMVGGIAALVGAIAVGPRTGRFDADASLMLFNSHSAPLQVLGTFILFVGWFGFNCGSTLGVAGYGADLARAAVTTTLCAVSGGLSTAALCKFVDDKWDLGQMCNGILAGLVSITAGCSVVESWASILIGFIGGAIYFAASRTWCSSAKRENISFLLHLLMSSNAKCKNNSHPCHFILSLSLAIIPLECHEKLNSRFALEHRYSCEITDR
jgi:Amt family ammonium transporter